MSSGLELRATYVPGGAGAFELLLVNRTGAGVPPAILSLQSITRFDDDVRIEGAEFVCRLANLHEMRIVEPIAAGASHAIRVDGLTHAARHCTDGPKSAYLETADGTRLLVDCAPLELQGGGGGPLRALPDGHLEVPLGLLPWPQSVEIRAWRDAAALRPVDADAAAGVAALAGRLFPEVPPPFSADGDVPLSLCEVSGCGSGGYQLRFDGAVELAFSDPAGLHCGLVSLAQMHVNAARFPDRFRVPQTGTIADRPRFGWRGCHIDVVRHFVPMGDLVRLVDILAWLKFNVLHLHLTDDEGWRLEIAGLPELTRLGAWRGPDEALAPQYGFSHRRYGGFYDGGDMAGLIAQAGALQIGVMPEIDIPGHSHAALTACPWLRDPDEPGDAYRSIQGYPNNALNPGVAATYPFLETVLGEVADLFPFPYLHIGADEVAANAWMASPLARAMMAREGIADTTGLQAHFLRGVQEMLRGLGKRTAGWDEVADGAGVARDGTVLIAWQSGEVVARLARAGYDVVAAPGQAYYLDMAQADGWDEPGTSWAGTVSVEASYAYDPQTGLGDAASRLIGVQAAIWQEHITTRAQFNHMVFPRLAAVAEAGWTAKAERSWRRFCAIADLVPRL